MKVVGRLMAFASVASVVATLALPMLAAFTAPAVAHHPKGNPAPLIGAGIPIAFSLVGGYFGYRLVKRKRG